MKTDEMISAIQTKLGIQVDGRAGPETWGAIYTHIVGLPLETAVDTVDARSEKSIVTLLPEVQPLARALVHKAAFSGIQIKILSGLRTYAEQEELYARGRTKPGNKVTNARGGHSNHNFAIAFDIGVFEGNKYLADSAKYKAVGALGMDIGLEWGGNWKTIMDQPHFQLRPAWANSLSEKAMLAELRTRTADKMAIYV
ncbi:MAG: M15 family metallopeptidase [Sulfuricurvum sp.]|jgi:peptidoglycan L-alanyl-D-glutamate endopeptidase CwlK|uniref:M15 family metallopeptidase n=1 Tax=Sulfuricurvum sp. TaxID=2025608 RepID=UPI0025D707D3|nr:M15 family metallopeptidase [Sulfuricurvum sp.]MCK9372612.1 M15 family metallopeptidase [Sulfuricurvum sp.]